MKLYAFGIAAFIAGVAGVLYAYDFGSISQDKYDHLADQGQSMLLVEHDMGLVLGICGWVVVLEFGKVIAQGAPEVVRRDPKVIAAYRGDGLESAATSGSAEETV